MFSVYVHLIRLLRNIVPIVINMYECTWVRPLLSPKQKNGILISLFVLVANLIAISFFFSILSFILLLLHFTRYFSCFALFFLRMITF